MLLKLVLNAIAFYVVSYIVPGVHITGIEALIVVSVVWGVLSVLLRPLLIILTLPINILTLGLFTFVINAILILLVAQIVPGFKVDSFTTALVASVVLALVNIVLGAIK